MRKQVFWDVELHHQVWSFRYVMQSKSNNRTLEAVGMRDAKGKHG